MRTFAVIFHVLGFRFTVEGEENLPVHGPAVLASNHIGFLDFTFIGYAARERGRLVRFMSKKSVFDAPVAGRLMRAMKHVSVDRWTGASAYRDARRRLDDGDVVGVFPEATISRSFRLKPFKPGAAGLAISRGVPLVPCIIWGSQRVMTVDGRRSLRRGKAITITLGAPLHASPDETVLSLTERLHHAMEALLDEAIASYPDQPRNDEDRWWIPADAGGTAPDVESAARLDREALARIGAPSD
ncbi:glycerol acyltransferase [Aeromicrobium sp. Root495]|nr:glycerol acyltransferase [Aeromicrobium sp. Root495]